MIDLSRIVQSAQGGSAVDTIAQRFGLSPAEAQSAIDALLPAIRMGLQNAAQNGNAGSILAHLGNPVHQQSFDASPGASPDPAAVQGGSILGSLFGGHQTTAAVTQQAANQSGVSPSIIQAMLPTIVSMVMGGLFRGAQTGIFGSALSSILGSVLGQGGQGPIGGTGPAGTGQSGAPVPAGEGGLGGLIGSVLGGLLGGSAAPEPSRADGGATAWSGGGGPASGSAPSATPESTLDELSAMVQAGTPSAPEHESRLASILGR